MTYSSMKITVEKTEGSYTRSIDFSEIFANGEMLIQAYGGGNNVALMLPKKQIIELRKHLTVQLNKIKNKPAK